MDVNDVERIKKNFPEDLRMRPNWVCYALEPVPGKKPKKVPKNPRTGRNAKSNDKSTWTDFEMACKTALARGFAGIGFMFDDGDIGIDFDNCIDENGVISGFAQDVLKTMQCYSEKSPSGTGIHSIASGTVEKSHKDARIEIYGRGRFFTVTGKRLTDYPAIVEDRTEELKEIRLRYRLDSSAKKSKSSKASSLSEFKPEDVDKIVERLSKGKDGARFQQLYKGQWGGYASQSDADFALTCLLTRAIGDDAKFIDAVFRKSGLYRDKWDEKHHEDGRTYGEGTIENAISAEKEKAVPQGELMMRMCENQIRSYVQDQQGRHYVSIDCNGHDELLRVDSDRFKHFIQMEYRKKYYSLPTHTSLKQVVSQIKAQCSMGLQVELFHRVGVLDGDIYYDLGGPGNKAVKINKSGWEIVNAPSIFYREPTQRPNVEPVLGGDFRELMKFVNVREDDACLCLVACVSFVIPHIPHPILNHKGAEGCGKSTNCRRIKALIDPSMVLLLQVPENLKEMAIVTDKNWLIALENVSSISQRLSDLICMVVTGAGSIQRSLYTDSDAFVFEFKRTVIFNGIPSCALRPDLLDRTIVFNIPPLQKRLREKDMDMAWSEAMPRLLGSLFTAISDAMKILDTVDDGDVPPIIKATCQ